MPLVAESRCGLNTSAPEPERTSRAKHRPLRELKGFDKNAIAPGETVEVVFLLEEAMLAFTGVDGVRRAEPGTFDVWIAPSCTGGTPARFVLA